VTKDRPHWHLALIGDGPQHQLLREQTRRLGLEERIHLPGRIQNVPEYLAKADIFVLPSLYEGFPNALCEAMASGLPVIATNCGTVADIITDRQNGLLVSPNSIDSLVAALTLLMDNPDLRLKLGVKAESVVERFSINAVMETWDRTLQRAIQATQRKR
jgi:glycosyltransferase involved in cell wall biosynthesis